MNLDTQKPNGPLIGITLDSEEASETGYSKFPYYALRENYASVVVKAGGVPVILPHEPSLIGSYLEIMDGLIITGGNFDVDPASYGAQTTHDTVHSIVASFPKKVTVRNIGIPTPLVFWARLT